MTKNNRRDDADVYPTAAPPPSSPRAAAARKGRHNKICTAGGMRDRRMCLSLDVARRFFSLQDKLGFDQASKTVQWLLDHVMVADAETCNCKQERMPKGRRRAGRKSNKGAPALLPDKESRARARQRARERTVERNRLQSSWASTVAAAAAADEAPAPAPAPARQVILPVIPSFGSYYEEQEPWELGGVVFAKPRLHY